MAIQDNYMFRPLLALFRLSSRELKVLIYTLATRPYRASSQSIPPHIEITLRNKALCRDLCTTCAHNVYSRALNSLEGLGRTDHFYIGGSEKFTTDKVIPI